MSKFPFFFIVWYLFSWIVYAGMFLLDNDPDRRIKTQKGRIISSIVVLLIGIISTYYLNKFYA